MAYSLALAASRRARLARHASKAATEVASLAYELFFSVYEGKVSAQQVFFSLFLGFLFLLIFLVAWILRFVSGERARVRANGISAQLRRSYSAQLRKHAVDRS
jgi:uncharacterized membrane protein